MRKLNYHRVRQAFAELALAVSYNPKIESVVEVSLSLLSEVISDYKVKGMVKRANKIKRNKSK